MNLKNGPYNILRTMIIAAFVPFADIYYVFKIHMLERYILISLIIFAVFTVPMILINMSSAIDVYTPIPIYVINIMMSIVIRIIQLYLIYKWITDYNLDMFGFKSEKDWNYN